MNPHWYFPAGTPIAIDGNEPEPSLSENVVAPPDQIAMIDACPFTGTPTRMRWMDDDHWYEAPYSAHIPLFPKEQP